MQTLAYYDSTNIEVRPSLTLELLPDEELELRPWGALEFVDGPGGVPPDVADSRIRCTEIGRYRFRLTNASGERHDLHLVCFEPAALDFVSSQMRGVGHGDSCGHLPMDAKVRGVVRSLANNAPWFDGTAASLKTGEPSRSLAQFGC